ncbi:MAG: Rho termination factor N-terminal domain-containing protein [Ilumatobacteraceae bacterium]
MPTATLTEQLDKLESNLPVVSARVLRLQRTLAGAAFDRTAAIVTTVAENTKAFLETARVSGKTVTGQARAAGSDVLSTTSTGIKTVTGQARAAGSDVLNTASTGAKTVAGQATRAASDVASTTKTGARTVSGQSKAQGKKVSKAATAQATKTVDSAIDAVEDKPGTGKPYEQWTKAELLERAQDLDIDGRSGLNKKQLIAALRAA